MEKYDYDIHLIAEMFPLMSDEEFEGLVESIRAGYDENEPIILFEGKILDGRNRYNACKRLGRTFPVKKFEGKTREEAEAFVIEKNLIRRHLTTAQKKELAKKFEAKGLTQEQIAAKLGLSQGRVSQLLVSNNLPHKSKKSSTSKPGKDGKTNEQTAKTDQVATPTQQLPTTEATEPKEPKAEEKPKLTPGDVVEMGVRLYSMFVSVKEEWPQKEWDDFRVIVETLINEYDNLDNARTRKEAQNEDSKKETN